MTLPSPARRAGAVTHLRELTPDIVEVVVALHGRLAHEPGQHVKVTFGGEPARAYCPTLRSDGSAELHELVFHIRRDPRGLISRQLGRRIRPGTEAVVRGPFGLAHHRPGPGRLVLVSAGIGWAPIWAIARAARFREPARELVVIAGARKAANLYMAESVAWLAATGVRRLVVTTTDPGAGEGFARGRPTLHLPKLGPDDVVHAAGTPGMVAAVALLAAAGGATCHASPFLPAGTGRLDPPVADGPSQAAAG